MKTQIIRLEEALRYWENSLFLITAMGLEGASPAQVREVSSYLPLKSHDFRRHLLGSRNADYRVEAAFNRRETYTAIRKTIGDGSAIFPQLLWSWSQRSRRSYTLSSDLQLQLSGTALSSIRVGDVPWPFDTFGIALPEPICTFGHQFDYLLVSRNECLEMAKGKEMIVILLICQHVRGMRYMPHEERKRITKEVHKGGRKDVGRFWDRYGLDAVSKEGCINPLLLAPGVETMFVDSLAQNLRNVADKESISNAKALATVVNRIVFGMCLYLSTLTPQERREYTQWFKVQGGIEGTSSRQPETITDESEVCAVTSVQAISDRDRELLRRIMGTGRGTLPSPHFCQGHWRRPPGKGDDPNAPRTVWVRPYETGVEQLGDNELPGGAMIRVK